MAQRSTKGASKQRRDAINERVAQIRELLPVSEAARSRLSQLQVMALAKSYIAKSNLFSTINHAAGMIDNPETTWSDHFDFLQAVPGYLTIFDLDGRILYISDNVCDYLGNSAVDIIAQTETLYDLVDERDHAVIGDALSPESGLVPPSSASAAALSSSVRHCDGVVSFVCRMNTAARGARYVPAPIKPGFERTRTMQVRGRRLAAGDVSSAVHGVYSSSTWRSSVTSARSHHGSSSSAAAFVAVCTPSLCAADVLSTSLIDAGAVAWDTTVFRSEHRVDMKFVNVDANGEYVLGYEGGTIYGKSWYEMIHPDDVEEARFKHMDLMQSSELSGWRSLCVRVQCGGGDVIWLHVVMRACDVTVDGVTARRVVCINQLIDDAEARVIRANAAAAAARDDAAPPFDLGVVPPHCMHGLLDGLLDGPRAGGTKRRASAADNWAAAAVKVARLGDRDDAPGLMSMPSPPLSGGGGDLGWNELAMASSFQVSVKSESPYVPEYFLTPNASPCSSLASSCSPPPPPVNHPRVLVSDQFDVGETSFFEHHSTGGGTEHLKTTVVIDDDQLPELDLPTVTSYFDLLEHAADPLPLTPPVDAPIGLDYCKALPVGVGAGLIDEEDDLLGNLFRSTSDSFLGSIPAAKPFDWYSGCDLLLAY